MAMHQRFRLMRVHQAQRILFLPLLFVCCSALVVVLASEPSETPRQTQVVLPLDQLDPVPGLSLPADFTVADHIRTGRLANGLPWVTIHQPQPKGAVSFRLLVSVGSRHETESEQGLAHYLEHLAFNGSDHFPDASLVTSLQAKGIGFGSHSNAHTGFDETVYKLDLVEPDAELLVTGFKVMEDFLYGLHLKPDQVDAERGVILAEMRDRAGPMFSLIRTSFCLGVSWLGLGKPLSYWHPRSG